MKLTRVLCSLVAASTAAAAPPKVKAGTQFEIRGIDEAYVHNAQLQVREIMEKRDLEKTIENLLIAVNDSGLIFNTLDLFADNPERLQGLANATGKLIDGAGSLNISINGLDFTKILGSLNLTGLVDAVVSSGLITSIADGILLDKNFRPKLERLIYNGAMSLRPTLKFVFNDILGSTQKRSLQELSREDIHDWVVRKRNLYKRDDATTTDFFDQLFGGIAATVTSTLGEPMAVSSQVQSAANSVASEASAYGSQDLFSNLMGSPAATTTSSTGSAASAANWLDDLFGSPSTAEHSPAQALSSKASATRTTASSTKASSTDKLSTTTSTSGFNFLGALFGGGSTSGNHTSSAKPTTSVDLSFGTGNSTSNSGTLGLLITNLLAGVLNSGLVEDTISDVLVALNNTGVAVYVVQEFIGNDKYINMTEDLISDIWDSGAINLNITSLLSNVNFTEIIGLGEKLLGGVDFGKLIDQALAGNFTSILSGLGKYTGAVGEIIDDLENKGLFYELNSYVFGTATASASQSASSTSAAKEDKKEANGESKDKSGSVSVAVSWKVALTSAALVGLLAL